MLTSNLRLRYAVSDGGVNYPLVRCAGAGCSPQRAQYGLHRQKTRSFDDFEQRAFYNACLSPVPTQRDIEYELRFFAVLYFPTYDAGPISGKTLPLINQKLLIPNNISFVPHHSSCGSRIRSILQLQEESLSCEVRPFSQSTFEKYYSQGCSVVAPSEVLGVAGFFMRSKRLVSTRATMGK